MRLLALLLVLITSTVSAEGWLVSSDKRVLHLRTEAINDAMFDIRCSNTYNILLGASYLTARLDDDEIINGFIIDDKYYPNYLDPDTPPDSRGTFNGFWEAMRNAKDFIILVDGVPRQVTTVNIYTVLPESGHITFKCRPVTKQGLLIN